MDVYVCICMDEFLYVFVFARACAHAHARTHARTDRQTDTHTHGGRQVGADAIGDSLAHAQVQEPRRQVAGQGRGGRADD